MSAGADATTDVAVEFLKQAREARAVLKMELAKLRARIPDTVILVFEGNDDKVIYGHWIRRARPGFQYEPFPCGGKEKVLKLRDSLYEDKSNLQEGVFFFVDRDFDDLQGRDGGNDIFMTDRYSVENYLVAAVVLEDMLKNEFHCHAQPDVRMKVIGLFHHLYEMFLAVTAPHNERLFYIRKEKIPIRGGLPKKLSELANVQLNSVSESQKTPDEVIMCEMGYAVDLSKYKQEFSQLDRKSRYRGKFSLLFFLKWISDLATEFVERRTDLFLAVKNTGRVHSNEFTIGMLAAKSDLPDGLLEFLVRLPPSLKECAQGRMTQEVLSNGLTNA